MQKPASLRKALTEALPELATSPENLIVFIDGGHIIASAARGLSHRFDYPLTIIVSDFAGEIAHLTTVIINWIYRNQFDLLQNPQTQDSGIKFNVTFASQTSVDIEITLDLRERVIVKDEIDESGKIARTYTYPPEPLPPE